MGKKSAAAISADTKFTREHYDRILLKIPKGTREGLKAAAKAAGAPSVNAYIASVLEKETGLELVLRGELPYKRKTDGIESETEK